MTAATWSGLNFLVASFPEQWADRTYATIYFFVTNTVSLVASILCSRVIGVRAKLLIPRILLRLATTAVSRAVFLHTPLPVAHLAKRLLGR